MKTRRAPWDYQRRQAPPTIEQIDASIEQVERHLHRERMIRKADATLEPEERHADFVAELDRFDEQVRAGEMTTDQYHATLSALAQNYGLVAS